LVATNGSLVGDEIVFAYHRDHGAGEFDKHFSSPCPFEFDARQRSEKVDSGRRAGARPSHTISSRCALRKASMIAGGTSNLANAEAGALDVGRLWVEPQIHVLRRSGSTVR
jgi:hypothetical protein